MNETEVKDMVRARYGGIAAGTIADCCAPVEAPACCTRAPSPCCDAPA